MKANKLLITLVCVSAVLLAVSVNGFGQKVQYNYLQGNDFSKYKTYRWVKLEKQEYPNQLLDEQIMRSIDAQLSAKGFSKIETEGADLLAIYQVAVTKERQWNAYSTNDGYWGWGGWGGWGPWSGPRTATSTTIRVGTLNLDFYDVVLKKQVWRGEATKTLKSPKDPKVAQQRIDRAMAKLLKNFPPPPRDD